MLLTWLQGHPHHLRYQLCLGQWHWGSSLAYRGQHLFMVDTQGRLGPQVVRNQLEDLVVASMLLEAIEVARMLVVIEVARKLEVLMVAGKQVAAFVGFEHSCNQLVAVEGYTMARFLLLLEGHQLVAS